MKSALFFKRFHKDGCKKNNNVQNPAEKCMFYGILQGI